MDGHAVVRAIDPDRAAGLGDYDVEIDTRQRREPTTQLKRDRFDAAADLVRVARIETDESDLHCET
jgi:hypothetical protein